MADNKDLDLSGFDEEVAQAEQQALDLSGFDEEVKPQSNDLLSPETGAIGGGITGATVGKIVQSPIENIALEAIASDMGVGKDFAKEYGKDAYRELGRTALEQDIYGVKSSPLDQLENLQSQLKSTGKELGEVYKEAAPKGGTVSLEQLLDEYRKIGKPKSSIDDKKKAYDTIIKEMSSYSKDPTLTTSKVVKTGEEISDLEKSLQKYRELQSSRQQKAEALGKKVSFEEPKVSDDFLTGVMQEDIDGKIRKTPIQTSIIGKEGARSLIDIIEQPVVAENLDLMDLQDIKKQYAKKAFEEGNPFQGSVPKKEAAAEMAKAARNKIEQLISEVDAGVGNRTTKLKELNSLYSQLSDLEAGVSEEAAKQLANRADLIGNVKRGTVDIAKRGVIKGAAKAASAIPLVGTAIGAGLSGIAGAIAAEPGESMSSAALRGAAESFDPFGSERIAPSEALTPEMKKQMREKIEKENVKGGIDYVKQLTKQHDKYLKYTPNDYSRIENKIMSSKEDGSKSYLGPLNKAVTSEDEREKAAIMYGLQQQPGFRKLMRDIGEEDND